MMEVTLTCDAARDERPAKVKRLLGKVFHVPAAIHGETSSMFMVKALHRSHTGLHLKSKQQLRFVVAAVQLKRAVLLPQHVRLEPCRRQMFSQPKSTSKKRTAAPAP